MAHVNESNSRREKFLGGYPVVLGDGDEWYVPRLRCSLGLGPHPEIRWTLEGCPAPGHIEEWTLSVCRELPNQLGWEDAIKFELELARELLLTNYDLSADDAEWLLRGHWESLDFAEWLAMWKRLSQSVIRPLVADFNRIRNHFPPLRHGHVVIEAN